MGRVHSQASKKIPGDWEFFRLLQSNLNSSKVSIQMTVQQDKPDDACFVLSISRGIVRTDNNKMVHDFRELMDYLCLEYSKTRLILNSTNRENTYYIEVRNLAYAQNLYS